MSRLAKMPIACPKGVEIKVTGNHVMVKGPKGSMEIYLEEGVEVEVKDGEALIKGNSSLKHMPFLGMTRSLLNNAVIGVSSGYEKKLELIGVGFKAAVKGNAVDLALGFSHPTMIDIPQGISVNIEKSTLITISGIDKRAVGQFAASIRAKRPPEPYKGKGVRYQNEYVRRKAGKTSK